MSFLNLFILKSPPNSHLPTLRCCVCPPFVAIGSLDSCVFTRSHGKYYCVMMVPSLVSSPPSPPATICCPPRVPRCPVRAVSMTRLDQLAQPTRRHGEHIRAVIERQKAANASSPDSMSSSVCSSHLFSHNSTPTYGSAKQRSRSMSRSLTHLGPNAKSTSGTSNSSITNTTTNRRPQSVAAWRPLGKTAAASKSMSTLNAATSSSLAATSSPARLARAYANAKSKMRPASGSASHDGSNALDVTGSGVCQTTSTSCSRLSLRTLLHPLHRHPNDTGIWSIMSS